MAQYLSIEEFEKLKAEKAILRKVLSDLFDDAKEWRDYLINQQDSFEGNEREMLVNQAAQVTQRLYDAKQILRQTA